MLFYVNLLIEASFVDKINKKMAAVQFNGSRRANEVHLPHTAMSITTTKKDGIQKLMLIDLIVTWFILKEMDYG